MFGPELSFFMYKCCFFGHVFCARQRAQQLRAELTLAQIRERLPNGWTDWHQIWHTCADSSGNRYTPNKLPLETQGALGGGGLGDQTFKSVGKLSNGWADWHQLWLVHVCGFIWSGNGYTPNKLPLDSQGGTCGVLGGQTFKSLGNLSIGLTDWHQLWFTSADSSENGHRLNTSRPSIPQGAFRGF